ncbi:trigger factor [uncultured Faecalibaculum sp.]|uniref:trigger factor n=1 Tax=uncultured Faecalibaculum sp. TaxID=1729681 RepID=UPI002608A191|nr:trigger factor [uncultured Faecalibaculum sp.]
MNWTKQENSTGTLTVTLEGEPWEKACAKAFNRMKANLNLKGFRKGQVPDALARKSIPAEAVYEEAAQMLAQQALDDGVKEYKLDLVARPVLNVKEADEKSVTLEFTCTVSPEVELGDWKSIKAEKKAVEVSEEEIEKEMQHLQDHFADWVLKEDDQPAEIGDQVTIDFVGMKDGTPFEGGSGENYPLVLGSNTFIPGFEDQLVGIKPEEKRTIEVTFPENYQVPDLAGQPATFEVTAHDIKARELPEINDELIARLKRDGIETVEKYKEEARNALMAQKEKQADDEFTNDILNQLQAMTTIDLPEVMTNGEVDRMYREFEQNIAQAGFTADQFLQATGQDKDAIRAQMKPEAESRVKMQLMLEALANQADIDITEDMINDEYKMLSEMYNMPAEQIRQLIYPDQIVFTLKQQKALDLLKKNAQE